MLIIDEISECDRVGMGLCWKAEDTRCVRPNGPEAQLLGDVASLPEEILDVSRQFGEGAEGRQGYIRRVRIALAQFPHTLITDNPATLLLPRQESFVWRSVLDKSSLSRTAR